MEKNLLRANLKKLNEKITKEKLKENDKK